MNKRDTGLIIAGSVLAADQLCKTVLLYGLGFIHFAPDQSVPVLPFFNLTMVWNPGISLGLFPASSVEGTVLLATFQMIAVGILGWWLWFVRKRTLAIGLGLVIGGALGNLIDRLVYGRVADFFHLFSFGYDFYVFNVADAAITFGALGLIYDGVLKSDAPQGEGQKE
jgi:signal peptidase II